MKTMKSIETPWGPSQSEDVIAPGVTLYTTSSHGGYHLSAVKRMQMPKDLREFRPFNDNIGWYEEDCDWAVVCLAFPDLFPPDAYRAAVATVARFHPELVTEERKAIAARMSAKQLSA